MPTKTLSGTTPADWALPHLRDDRRRGGRTERAFSVNLFVHGSAKADPDGEAAWLRWLASVLAKFGA